MRNRKQKSLPRGCQLTEIGIRDGCQIKAITDVMGAQVVVKGGGVHLLSQPLENHAAAEKLGKEVLAGGTGVYAEWQDVKKTSLEAQFFAVMAAVAEARP